VSGRVIVLRGSVRRLSFQQQGHSDLPGSDMAISSAIGPGRVKTTWKRARARIGLEVGQPLLAARPGTSDVAVADRSVARLSRWEKA